jgi:hypothetical protein
LWSAFFFGRATGNGSVSTAHYFAEGGLSHRQALGKALELTENEVNLTSACPLCP